MEMEPEDEDAGPTFAQAFDHDLLRSGLEQSQICEMLSEKDEVPISTAAISNWKKRDRLPYTRLQKLVEIFGPESECAAYMRWVDTQQPSRLTPSRRPALTVASTANMLLTGKAAGEEVEQRLTRLLAVLYQIPEGRRVSALRAATETLLDHLPPPPKQ